MTGTSISLRSAWPGIVLAALFLTLSNAWKPVVVDDTAYLMVAKQISTHPGDPYGFELLWRDEALPANQILAPAVLPYWLAGAIALFDGSVLAWKLWLLPFALALSFATYHLTRRIAPGHELLGLCVVVLTPGVLAGFNLMTDVPALALALLALALALDAIDSGRIPLALVSGLIAGLSMQTKYAAVGPLVVAVLYGFSRRQLGVSVCIAASAVSLFLGWEGYLVLRYGESHLSMALSSATSGDQRGFALSAIGWLCLLGAICPGIGLLLLVGAGSRTASVVAAAAIASMAVGTIALLEAPPSAAAYLPSGSQLLGPEILPLAVVGIGVFGSIVLLAWRWRGEAAGPASTHDMDRVVWLWVAVEVGLYIFFSPFRFLAARRLLGLSIALVFLALRAIARAGDSSEQRRGTVVALTFTALYALLFQISDISDAVARRQAVNLTANRLEDQGVDLESDTVWFAGHWAFRFYAEQKGMRPILPGRSIIDEGDWLLVPSGVSRQALEYPGSGVRSVGRITASSPWPWSTIPGAYIGMLPLRRQPQSQVEVELFQATRGFVPGVPYSR